MTATTTTAKPAALFEEIAFLASQLNEFLFALDNAETLSKVTAAQAMVRSIGRLADFGAEADGGSVACGDIHWLLPAHAVTTTQEGAATAGTDDGGAA